MEYFSARIYGSTESVPHAFVRPDEALALNGTTSGRAMEGVEIRVVDEDGNDVGVGVPGEELSRGPSVFVGYLKARETRMELWTTMAGSTVVILCIMDEHEISTLSGSKKDMIVRGGENLNTNEINDALEDAPEWGIIPLSECRMTVSENESARLRFRFRDMKT